MNRRMCELLCAAGAIVAVLTPWTIAGQRPTASPGVYHTDPAHLWNRVHDALFVRIGSDGQEYGRDRVEPYLWRESKHLLGGDSHERLLSVLAEFNRGGESLITDPLKRALLQRDLWLVFSWLEHSHNEFYGFPGSKVEWQARRDELREPLARAIGRVALTAPQIAGLPDTYAAAVTSREFAARFDPAQPDRPYLPPDLFAADGPWACLGRRDDLIAPAHVLSDNPFTTSAFLVFIKLPGGRDATRAFVNRLGAFNGPPYIKTTESPTPQFPNFNPDIPQFPAGTEVALVRRAMLVTSTLDLAVSPLVEDVQVRVYRQVPAWNPSLLSRAMLSGDDVRSWQSFYEFLVSRRRLFAGQSGGLRAVAVDDQDLLTGFSTHGVDPFDARPGESPTVTATRPGGARQASTARRPQPGPLFWCVGCHNLPGVYSFNTVAQHFTLNAAPPGRLAAMTVADVLASAVAWKQKRADWELLQRLLQRPVR